METLKQKIQNFNHKTLLKYLKAGGQEQKKLFKLSRSIKEEVFNRRVWYRGIIEFSNICQNDCAYCGIRKSNREVGRYQMNLEEIKASLSFISRSGYGSVGFLSREIFGRKWEKYLLSIVRLCRKKYP